MGEAEQDQVYDQVVVFDLGMVLVTPYGLHERLAAEIGVSTEQLDRAYWVNRHAYDQGISDHDYWLRTFQELGLPAERLDGLVPRLVQIDIEGWSQLRPEARQILADLRERDRRVAVLSNMPTTLGYTIGKLEWSSLIDRFFFSGPMGVAKPDAAIYREVTEGLGARQLWFIDDKIENVEAAAGEGWQAHLWRDDSDTRAWLRSSGLL